MQSVGTRIREARIKKGYTLEEINARTRISLKNLNAIESDDLSKISSPFTYRSFVKQIADITGVEYDSLAPDVVAASSTMPEPLVPGQEEEVYVRPHQFQVVKPRRNLTWLYRTASIALVAGLISGYLIWRNGGIQAAKLPASSRVLASPTVDPPVSVVQSQSAPVMARVEQPAVQEEAPPPAPGTEQLLPPSASPTPKLQPVSVEIARPAEPESPIHVELFAVQPTWLSITADGKTTFTGVLGAMKSQSLHGKESAEVRTDNAGGITFVFNGRPLGSLGKRGQSRVVVFSRTGYDVVQGAHNNNSSLTGRINPSGE